MTTAATTTKTMSCIRQDKRIRTHCTCGSERSALTSGRKGVLKMNNAERWLKHDADDVEADFRPLNAGSRCIAARRTNDVGDFFVANGALGSAKFGRRTGFYFNKDGLFAVAGNDVDFNLATSRPVVTSEHRYSSTDQIAVGQIFTTLTQCNFGR